MPLLYLLAFVLASLAEGMTQITINLTGGSSFTFDVAIPDALKIPPGKSERLRENCHLHCGSIAYTKYSKYLTFPHAILQILQAPSAPATRIHPH